MAGDGVSTYLALTFGTLLSSQGTEASFVLTLSGFPPGAFPSVLRFRLYQIFSRPDFLGAFQVPASAFPFPAVPTLSEVSGRIDRAPFPIHREGGFCGIKVLEADRHSLSPSRFNRAPGNCSNLPPHAIRVNGSCGAMETVAVQRRHPHIRRPSAQRRCVRLHRHRPCRRPGPHVRPGHRRRQGRPAPRRCRCRCGPRWAGRTE